MHSQQGGEIVTQFLLWGDMCKEFLVFASKGRSAFVQGELAFMQGELIVSPEF
jgi:hypothetical protein